MSFWRITQFFLENKKGSALTINTGNNNLKEETGMSRVHTANETKIWLQSDLLANFRIGWTVRIFAFRVHKHPEKRRLTSFIEVFWRKMSKTQFKGRCWDLQWRRYDRTLVGIIPSSQPTTGDNQLLLAFPQAKCLVYLAKSCALCNLNTWN